MAGSSPKLASNMDLQLRKCLSSHRARCTIDVCINDARRVQLQSSTREAGAVGPQAALGGVVERQACASDLPAARPGKRGAQSAPDPLSSLSKRPAVAMAGLRPRTVQWQAGRDGCTRRERGARWRCLGARREAGLRLRAAGKGGSSDALKQRVNTH